MKIIIVRLKNYLLKDNRKTYLAHNLYYMIAINNLTIIPLLTKKAEVFLRKALTKNTVIAGVIKKQDQSTMEQLENLTQTTDTCGV